MYTVVGEDELTGLFPMDPPSPSQAVNRSKRSKRNKRLSEEEVSRSASRTLCLRPDCSFRSVRVAMLELCSTH